MTKINFPKKISISFIMFPFTAIKDYFSIKPTQQKDWNVEQAVLPYAEVDKNIIKIFNIRNFQYDDQENIITNCYENRVYNLEQLSKVYFVVSHFHEMEGVAHTFLSFEFENEKPLVISVEARRDKKLKEYSPFKGLLRNYELFYLLGDENDIVRLRTHIRKERVYFYPVTASKQKLCAMLMAIIEKTNKLHKEPEFYHTWVNNCASNLLSHVMEISDRKISWSYTTIFPGYADELAYKLKLIPTDLPFQEIKKKYFVDREKIDDKNEEEFSKSLRKAVGL